MDRWLRIIHSFEHQTLREWISHRVLDFNQSIKLMCFEANCIKSWHELKLHIECIIFYKLWMHVYTDMEVALVFPIGHNGGDA